MDTPEAPDHGAFPALYGDGCQSINRHPRASRRRVLAGIAAALPVAALPHVAAGRRPADPASATYRTLGGKPLLDRVRAIGWLGAAEVTTPERALRIAVETRVEPFVRARSRTWLAERGPAAARTLIIEPDAGFIERDGRRTALPRAQEIHERQQYGLYGYMLMRAPHDAQTASIRAAQPGLPPIAFRTDADGRLIGADYTVAAPDGGEVIQEVFGFDGVVSDHGLHWPRRIRIAQNGVPFFTLAIDTLRVELA